MISKDYYEILSITGKARQANQMIKHERTLNKEQPFNWISTNYCFERNS